MHLQEGTLLTGPSASQKSTGMGGKDRQEIGKTWLIRGKMRSETWVQIPSVLLPKFETLEK